jgi:hypothetical protein
VWSRGGSFVRSTLAVLSPLDRWRHRSTSEVSAPGQSEPADRNWFLVSVCAGSAEATALAKQQRAGRIGLIG